MSDDEGRGGTGAAADYQRLLDARERCDAAYADARRLVFDQHPPGAVDVERLTSAQRAALVRLAQAEQDVERLRRLCAGE